LASRGSTHPERKSSPVSGVLEIVCLKCLRKEPKKRYATAAELADDLKRAVNNEPVMARPVARVEKTCLWCKRHPPPAGLIAASVVLAAAAVMAPQNVAHVRRTAEIESNIDRAETLVDALTAAPPEAV
jgi:serine/threonine-protein kinase